MDRITIVKEHQTMLDIIETRKPLGRFLMKDGSTWIAIDNHDGNAWTEEFKTKRKAIKWLKGFDEFE